MSDDDADDLVFYTNPMSRGRIVRWMLEEVGQPYRTELLDYGTTMKAPAYLAVNPLGKVPALRHGETVVTEAAAICAYLADAFPEAGLAPPLGSRARGPYFRWLFLTSGPLEAALTDHSLGATIPDNLRGMVGYGPVEAMLDLIEAALATGPYLAGERFTAADVYVGAHLGWGMQGGRFPSRPTFEAYCERVSGRPAAVKARSIDDALLPPKPPAA